MAGGRNSMCKSLVAAGSGWGRGEGRERQDAVVGGQGGGRGSQWGSEDLQGTTSGSPLTAVCGGRFPPAPES